MPQIYDGMDSTSPVLVPSNNIHQGSVFLSSSNVVSIHLNRRESQVRLDSLPEVNESNQQSRTNASSTALILNLSNC